MMILTFFVLCFVAQRWFLGTASRRHDRLALSTNCHSNGLTNGSVTMDGVGRLRCPWAWREIRRPGRAFMDPQRPTDCGRIRLHSQCYVGHEAPNSAPDTKVWRWDWGHRSLLQFMPPSPTPFRHIIRSGCVLSLDKGSSVTSAALPALHEFMIAHPLHRRSHPPSGRAYRHLLEVRGVCSRDAHL